MMRIISGFISGYLPYYLSFVLTWIPGIICALQNPTPTPTPTPNPGKLRFYNLPDQAIEDDEDGGMFIVLVERYDGFDGAVTVQIETTSGGTATPNVDYQSAGPTTLSWNNGQGGTKQFAISIYDDSMYEIDETVKINLSNASGGVQLPNPTYEFLTIISDDPLPTITLAPPSSNPDFESSVNKHFIATLSNPTYQEVSFICGFSGTATYNVDYSIDQEEFEYFIPSGDTEVNISFTIVDDLTPENDELISASIFMLQNASYGTPISQIYTIWDNDRDPIVYFDMEEGGGTTAINYGTAGSNGTIEGTPEWVSGPYGYGKALKFDGVDDRISNISTNGLNLNQGSVVAWVSKVQSTGTQSVLLGISQTGNTNDTARIRVEHDGVRVYNTNRGNYATFTSTFSQNLWRSVVITWSTDRNYQRIYVDGELKISKSYDGTAFGAPSTYQRLGSYFNNYFWKGILDEFKIYDRVLTDNEIANSIPDYTGGWSGNLIADIGEDLTIYTNTQFELSGYHTGGYEDLSYTYTLYDISDGEPGEQVITQSSNLGNIEHSSTTPNVTSILKYKLVVERLGEVDPHFPVEDYVFINVMKPLGLVFSFGLNNSLSFASAETSQLSKWSPVGTVPPFSPPANYIENGDLVLKAINNNVSTFGFWESPSLNFLSRGAIYKGYYNVASPNAADKVPHTRLRIYDNTGITSANNTASIVEIKSDGYAPVPVADGTRYESYYFPITNQLQPDDPLKPILFGFDMINMDPSNEPNGEVHLRKMGIKGKVLLQNPDEDLLELNQLTVIICDTTSEFSNVTSQDTGMWSVSGAWTSYPEPSNPPTDWPYNEFAIFDNTNDRLQIKSGGFTCYGELRSPLITVNTSNPDYKEYVYIAEFQISAGSDAVGGYTPEDMPPFRIHIYSEDREIGSTLTVSPNAEDNSGPPPNEPRLYRVFWFPESSFYDGQSAPSLQVAVDFMDFTPEDDHEAFINIEKVTLYAITPDDINFRPLPPTSGTSSSKSTPEGYEYFILEINPGQNFNADIESGLTYTFELYDQNPLGTPIYTMNVPKAYDSDSNISINTPYLQPDTNYWWRVQTIDAFDDVSEWSTVWNFSTSLSATSPPTPSPTPTPLPNPRDIADPVPEEVSPDFYKSVKFLFDGSNKIQFDVDYDAVSETYAITRECVSVVRGQVFDQWGQPLSGVKISVQGKPELGYTFSRSDGWFDIAVNGGSLVTIKYEAEIEGTYFPCLRAKKLSIHDYCVFDEVVLTQLDKGYSGVVDLANITEPQVVGGRTFEDVVNIDGVDVETERHGMLMFFPETEAVMEFDGSGDQTITDPIKVYLTEYTVGDLGPNAMPAPLPPTSQYTYCAEFSVDEAINAGAKSVRFDSTGATYPHRVIYYLDNFLGFEVGGNVPKGFLNVSENSWVAEDDGVVISVLNSANPKGIDWTGDGNIDSPNGDFTQAEIDKLLEAYPENLGDLQLWRIPITHFTPFDFNWNWFLDKDAIFPKILAAINPFLGFVELWEPLYENYGWGTIDVQSQVFNENVAIPGTNLSLHYLSSRTDGYRVANTLSIPVWGDDTIGSLEITTKDVLINVGFHGTIIRVEVAGRMFAKIYTVDDIWDAIYNENLPLSYEFSWDGIDAYGRRLDGTFPVKISLGYMYQLYYGRSGGVRTFGDPPDGTVYDVDVTGRTIAVLWQKMKSSIGTKGVGYAHAQGLGGWTISEHHYYDPSAQVLYRGDGKKRRATIDLTNSLNKLVAGTGAPTAEGTPHKTVAGIEYHETNTTENGLATTETMLPCAISISQTGKIYFTEWARSYSDPISWPMLRYIDDDGKLKTVWYDVDTPADDILDYAVTGHFDIGNDGNLYIPDNIHECIWKYDPIADDWTIIAGDVAPTPPDTLGPESALGGSVSPNAVTCADDGSIYFVEKFVDSDQYYCLRIRKLSLSNYGPNDPYVIETVAGSDYGSGNPIYDFTDRENAKNVRIRAEGNEYSDLAILPDGSIIFAARGYSALGLIVRLGTDGLLYRYAGYAGVGGQYKNGVHALESLLFQPSGITVSQEGNVYIGELTGRRVREILPNGIIRTIAGIGETGANFGKAGLNELSRLYDTGMVQGVTVGPDGHIYYCSNNNSLGYNLSFIRKIIPLFPPRSDGEYDIVSKDGTQIYRFYADGRHKETRDSITGDLIATFTYTQLPDSTGSMRLTKITDAHNNETVISRDTNGVPTSIIPPLSPSIGLECTNGYLSAITFPGSRKLQFGYKSGGLLNKIVSPKHEGTSNEYNFEYTHLGLLKKATDPLGNFVTLERSGGIDPDDPNSSFMEVKETTSEGVITVHRAKQSPTGRLTRTIIIPTGPNWQDPDNYPDDRVEHIVVNDDGIGLTQITRTDGTSIKVQEGRDVQYYFESPIVKELETIVHNTSGGTYKKNTLKTSQSYVTNPDIKYTESATLWDSGLTAATKRVSTSEFIVGSNPSTFGGWHKNTVTSPEGRKFIYYINDKGLVVCKEYPNFKLTYYEYDQYGRLTTITFGKGDGIDNEPDGMVDEPDELIDTRIATLQYTDQDGSNGSPNGYLWKITNPENQTVTYHYDSRNYIDQLTLPGNIVLEQTFDDNGNVTELLPPGKTVPHEMTYTEIDQLLTYEAPNGDPDKLEYEYDTDRKIKQFTRVDDQYTKWIRDNYGRLTDFELYDSGGFSQGDITYTYTNKNQVDTVSGPGTAVIDLDHIEALLSDVTFSGPVAGSVNYDYSDFFEITSISVNDQNAILYDYDKDGLPVEVGDLTLVYDTIDSTSNGPLNQTYIEDPTNAGYRTIDSREYYDSTGELETYSAERWDDQIPPSITHEFYSYTLYYNSMGRIDKIEDTIQGNSKTYEYTYTPQGRLDEVFIDTVLDEDNDYDDNGNRYAEAITPDWNYNAEDQLTATDTASYTYYDDGELKTKTVGANTTTYYYDVIGNLIEVEFQDGSFIEYEYDGFGRLLVRREYDNTPTLIDEKRYIYGDLLNIIAELDQNNKVLSRFVYGTHAFSPDYMIKYDSSGTETGTYRIFRNHLGSPRLIVDIDDPAVIPQRMDYDVWGKVTYDSSACYQPFGFAGGYYDSDTGLVLFGARWYDPEVGRFISKDPILFAGGDPNLYAYCFNDPVNKIDPSGLYWLDTFQFSLDGFGLFPALGEPCDLLNGTIYLFRKGRKTDAALSYAGAIPFAGWFATGTRFGKRIFGGVMGFADDAARYSDETADALNYTPKKGKPEVQKEVVGEPRTESEFLDDADNFLGDSPRQLDEGVYRSADGSRQVRFTGHDLTDKVKGPHGHLERIAPDGTHTENIRIPLK